MAEQAPFYIFTAFVFAYGIGTLKVSRDLLLTAVLAASVRVVLLDSVRRPSVGPVRPQARVHDRARLLTGIFGLVYFALLDTLRAVLDLRRHRAVADPA